MLCFGDPDDEFVIIPLAGFPLRRAWDVFSREFVDMIHVEIRNQVYTLVWTGVRRRVRLDLAEDLNDMS